MSSDWSCASCLTRALTRARSTRTVARPRRPRGSVRLTPSSVAPEHLGHQLGGRDQGLAGHAVGEHGRAAEPVGVDDGDLGAELGGDQRGLVPPGPPPTITTRAGGGHGSLFSRSGQVIWVPGGRGARRSGCQANQCRPGPGVEPPALDGLPPDPGRLEVEARWPSSVSLAPVATAAEHRETGERRDPREAALRDERHVHHQGSVSTASSVAGRPTPRPARPSGQSQRKRRPRRRRAMYSPCGHSCASDARPRAAAARGRAPGRPRTACALPTRTACPAAPASRS